MKQVVAGVDFTDASRRSLREAMRLADGAAGGGMVHALHVIDTAAVEELRTALGQPDEQLEGRVRLDTKRLMEAFIEEGGGGPGRDRASLTVEVVVGTPSEAIIEYARKVEADLIVMARNSSSDSSRGAGATAVQVVRHASANVLLVRQDRAGPYRRVVACVDFSEHSGRAVRQAAAVAAHDDAELHLVHAYRPFWDVIPFGAMPIDVTSEVQNEQRQLLEKRLSRLAEATREKLGGREIGRHVIPAGSAASAIVEFLAEHNADLAVVASHGRTGLSRVFLGSIAERIIRDAPCSVLTCKANLDDLTPSRAAQAR